MAAPAANRGGYCIIPAAGWVAIGEGAGGAGGCRNRRSPARHTLKKEARARPGPSRRRQHRPLAPPQVSAAARGAAGRGAGRGEPGGGAAPAPARPPASLPSSLPPCRSGRRGGRRAWERMMQSAGGPGSPPLPFPPPVKSRLGSGGHPRAPQGRGRRSGAAADGRPPGPRARRVGPRWRGDGAGRAPARARAPRRLRPGRAAAPPGAGDGGAGRPLRPVLRRRKEGARPRERSPRRAWDPAGAVRRLPGARRAAGIPGAAPNRDEMPCSNKRYSSFLASQWSFECLGKSFLGPDRFL